MKRGYVDTPNGQIHYRTAGSGEPVVVFHETPFSSLRMAPFIAELGKEMRAIGMDTPGYGLSERPPVPYTTMHEFAQSVAWLVDGLGVGPVHLYGVLTGSQIALQTAADFPGLVKSVAVAEPFNWSKPSRRAVHEKLHRYYPRREDGGHLIDLWNRTEHWNKEAILQDLVLREQGFLDYLTVNEDSGADVYEGMGWEGAAPYAMCRQDIWSVAPRIQAPVLVMYEKDSERGRALPRFLATLPRSRGLDAAPNFRTDPAGAAKLLIDFYRSPGV